MEKLVCECCGGQIDAATMKCRYCGTQYRDENDRIVRIETFRNPVKVFSASLLVEDDLMRRKDGAEYAVKMLANELAKSIPSVMEVRSEYDPIRMATKMQGIIKVVQPVNVSNRFNVSDGF